jgi:hypothetical protein
MILKLNLKAYDKKTREGGLFDGLDVIFTRKIIKNNIIDEEWKSNYMSEGIIYEVADSS